MHLTFLLEDFENYKWYKMWLFANLALPFTNNILECMGEIMIYAASILSFIASCKLFMNTYLLHWEHEHLIT